MSKSKFDFLRPLTDEEYSGLKASIAARGQISPIIRDQNGVTIDGHHRERALTELGIPESEWKIEIRSFATDDERFDLVGDANLHRRQLTPEDRKRVAEHFASLGWTIERIAAYARIGKSTIGRDLRDFSHDGKIPPRAEKRGRPKGSGLAPKPIEAPAARTAPTGKIAEPIIDPSMSAQGKIIADLRSDVARLTAELAQAKHRVFELAAKLVKASAEAADPSKREKDLEIQNRHLIAEIKRLKQSIERRAKAPPPEPGSEAERTIKGLRTQVKNLKAQLAHLTSNDDVSFFRSNKATGAMSFAVYTKIARCLHPDREAITAERAAALTALNEWKADQKKTAKGRAGVGQP